MALSINIGHNKAEPGATQINNVTNHFGATSEQEIDRTCLETLRCPDSRKIKNRLKRTKDELLRDSYKWILSNEQYCRWRDGDDLSLLWIKGGAGKGKTMMSIGLSEELSHNIGEGSAVIYFFCQNADYELNTVTAILKGLIFRLVQYQQTPIKVLRRNWDLRKNEFVVDVDNWQTLWDIFLEMLDNCQSTGCRIYILLDALDECQTETLTDFVRTIIRTGLERPKQIKWLLTSRPLGDAEHELARGTKRIYVSLELNADQVDRGIQNYIIHRVQKLALLRGYNAATTAAVEEAIHIGANGAFLWASLVCNQLEAVPVSEAVSAVRRTPPELERLYDQIYRKLCASSGSDVPKCLQLLQVLMLAYRPLRIPELISIIAPIDGGVGCKILVDQCSTFIRVRGDSNDEFVEFVHQSARDYLTEHHPSSPVDSKIFFGHDEMAASCLSHLIDNLYTNLLQWPDNSATRTELIVQGLEPLSGFGYAAQFWIDHLHAATETGTNLLALVKNKSIEKFLRCCFLEWLECLSLLDQLPRAVEGLEKMLEIVRRNEELSQTSSCLQWIQDAYRFLKRHYTMILQWPLQVYISAVFFSPEASSTRQENLWRLPKWLQEAPVMETRWSPLQQTLAGRSNLVRSLVFSPDGRLIASASYNDVVKIWDLRTGQVQQKLKHRDGALRCVAFSHDAQFLASYSRDGTIGLWDVKTGQFHVVPLDRWKSTIHSGPKAFSPDGHLLALSSGKQDLQIYEVKTGHVRSTLSGQGDLGSSVAFSPDGHLLASGSCDYTIKLWQVRTGQLQRTIRGHSNEVRSIKFSSDGQLLASFDGENILLWNVGTGQMKQTLKDNTLFPSLTDFSLFSMAFLSNGQLLASAGTYGHGTVWNVETGQVRQIHDVSGLVALSFSPNGQLIATATLDGAVKIWENETDRIQLAKSRHIASIQSIKICSKTQKIETTYRYQAKSCVIGMGEEPQTRYDVLTSIKRKSKYYDTRKFVTRFRRQLSSKVDGLDRLHVQDQWVLCGSTRFLKLPLEYIATCYDEDGDLIAIGFEIGEMWHFFVDRKVLTEGCAAYTGVPSSARSSSIPTGLGPNVSTTADMSA